MCEEGERDLSGAPVKGDGASSVWLHVHEAVSGGSAAVGEGDDELARLALAEAQKEGARRLPRESRGCGGAAQQAMHQHRLSPPERAEQRHQLAHGPPPPAEGNEPDIRELRWTDAMVRLLLTRCN